MTLTDRYVAATLRNIPANKRDDIERELRGSIADAVDARIDSGDDSAEAEKYVLTDLGDPARLAADYSERPLYLIGPDLYLDWRRLLAVLLWIAPIPGIVVLVLDAFEGSSVLAAFGSGIWTAATVALHIVFWTTLVFAVLERTGGSAENPTGAWTPERLPEVDDERRVSLSDTVFAVAVYVFLFVFLILQRTYSGFRSDDGTAIAILEPGLWSFWIPALLVLLVLSAVFEIVRYAIGGWTVPLAVINTVLNLLFTVPVIWLAASDELFEPDYLVAAFGEATDSARVASTAVIVVVALIAVWEIGEGWVKALRDPAPRVRQRRTRHA